MVHVPSREPVIDRPAFCPNPTCRFHAVERTSGVSWFVRFGFFPTRSRGPIRRFRCRACGKTCSSQTFSTHYWTHMRGNLEHLENQLTSASGLRQIGRMNGYSYRVVKNRTHRLARQYLTLFAYALSTVTPNEDGVFDGFESYLRSQYFPTNINILVGADSQACYAVNAVVMRRKGRMTRNQKRIRAIIDRVWRPKANAVEEQVRALFTDMWPVAARAVATAGTWTLRTDEKCDYPRALRRIDGFRRALEAGTIRHMKTSSRRARTSDNPLFAVNYLDRQIRKDMGEHVRETVKQGRELNCSMERMVIALGRHTFGKPYRISNRVKTEDEPTHAGVAGMDTHRRVLAWREWIYTHRQVYTHLPSASTGEMRWIRTIWKREYENPPIVDLEREVVKETGQPKERWFAKHLVA